MFVWVTDAYFCFCSTCYKILKMLEISAWFVLVEIFEDTWFEKSEDVLLRGIIDLIPFQVFLIFSY